MLRVLVVGFCGYSSCGRRGFPCRAKQSAELRVGTSGVVSSRIFCPASFLPGNSPDPDDGALPPVSVEKVFPPGLRFSSRIYSKS
jgi:hypothetical protein